MGFLHLSALTDEELSVLRKCIYEQSCDDLVQIVRSQISDQKHDVHRHRRETLFRVYTEMKRIDPIRLIDAYDVFETRLRSAIYPSLTSTTREQSPTTVQKIDSSVSNRETALCPKCKMKGVVKPRQRKKGYRIRTLFYVYHPNRDRCFLKRSYLVELKNRFEKEVEKVE